MSLLRLHHAALIAFALVSPLAAQEKEKLVHGTIQEIDVDIGTLTVTSLPRHEVKKFNLARRDLPVVDPLEVPLKLTDLRKHHRVALTVVGDENVTAIKFESDLEWGVIKSIDPVKQQLVLTVGYVTRPIDVGPAVTVIHDGKPGTLKDIKALGAIRMLLTPDRMAVRQVWTGKGVLSSNPYCARTHITGFVTAVDQTKRKLTLLTSDRYKPMEFDFDAWTYVRLTFSSYVLGDMPVARVKGPFKVSLYVDTDTKRASSLSIDAPFIVRRVVEKLDRERRTLTIAPAADDPQEEFPIAADAQILYAGRPTTLARVREKGLVSFGLSLDQREVIFLMCLDR